ncbi:phage baseplate assembly protein [Yersinia ruckeri]|uniref:phage baseplate assembly protein n=1 Tax=Yersinia ruckeri TaxID=29486 RepID=UPI0008FD92D7|nr:phage tail protein [Yersinia ruckeri]MCK8550324.1 phage tail protein [Yersinia ruckeri]MCK8572580.1 phage tail protein [Yersinia ruckeri]MCK8578982.1 phage tail protein [Yersinia ruckeri]MCK8582569.1 phage tail protein [Yersinia ruckeri]MCW6518949.1 phage tail protein [Yersinia ruckeri]
MPTPSEKEQDNRVSILINGKVHSAWSRYQIDSDFLIPADAWSVSLGLPDGVFPPGITRGVPVQVKVGADTVMVGRVDSIQRNIARKQCTLLLSGRDGAAILVDCAAPIFTSRQLGLEEVIANIVRPLGITKIRINAESAIRNDKVSIEPGERAWDALVRAAAGRGLWPWFEPDGTLVVGGPDYTTPPVATLIMRFDGEGNNLLSLNDNASINGSFSELTVLAQGHGQGSKSSTDLGIVDIDSSSIQSVASDEPDDDIGQDAGTAETGTHGLKTVIKDPTVPYYRPHIMVVGDADNLDQVRYRGRKAMADARLAGYSLTGVVAGHRNSDGILWQPGQRIHVRSEPHGIDGIFFLMGREFISGRPEGETTTLRLKEDGIWIPDAFPKKKKGRKKKKTKELGIVDVE